MVVSPRFLMRSTPPDELAATAALRREDDPLVLPLWYRVTEEQIRARSPEIADLPSAKWSEGVPAAAATLWGMNFPRVPRERSGPITPLPEAATVADVLRPLRDVAARRLAYDEPLDDHDHALVKGLRALLEMWLITVDSSDASAEGVMIEAFRMAFDDLNGSACRMFAGRVEDSPPDADPREIRPLGVVVIGRPDARAAELVGDWVVVRR
ncbi:MAG TPA: hypothetical protein VMH39_01700 [Gemmatimonadaceae bacterium]|nr:hypothetical protein [Gemmatimonadaceae bacterium]